MYLKDYYGILQVEPSATVTEIKKAYRRLALQYHPDKNNNDPYASAQFTAIKEAYEVLTNPSRRAYYLQQRWYDLSIGKRKKEEVVTPVSVLRQALELERYVSTLDVFRMDKTGLQDYILGLLADPTIEIIHSFHEPETTREITAVLLRAMRPLPAAFTKKITAQLLKLAGDNPASQQQITSFTRQTEKKYRRDKYSLIIILAATILLCLLIYLAGR